MLRKLAFLTAMLTASVSVSSQAMAQSVDLEFGYTARETRPTTDNDLFLLPIGLTWSRPDGGTRVEFLLAARNENFSGAYPATFGVEALYFKDYGPHRVAGGVRVNHASDITTTGELLAGYEYYGGSYSLRGTAGYWTSEAVVPGRTDTSGLAGVMEATWYPGPKMAVRLGLQADEDGSMAGLGLEYQIGRSDFSIAAEVGYGLGTYRGQNSYENLAVTIRWTPGGGSPKARDRMLGDRLLHRYAWVQ
jgi:hypothetical protein